MNWAQQQFDCCQNPSSNINSTICSNGDVKSCYPDEDCKKKKYTDDCKNGFIDFAKKNLVVIGAVALAIAFVQVRRSFISNL